MGYGIEVSQITRAVTAQPMNTKSFELNYVLWLLSKSHAYVVDHMKIFP